MNKTIVFCESSVKSEEIKNINSSVTVHKSVVKGDTIDAVNNGFTKIIIIDGLFSMEPSVWHKEILFAIEKGVNVIGCASMGAIRASELYEFGMIGYGKVFDAYKTGQVTDDSEVAIEFYREKELAVVTTIPMINIRLSLSSLGVIHTESIIRNTLSLHYKERTWENIAKVLSRPEYDLLRSVHKDYKYLDAIQCIRLYSNGQPIKPTTSDTFKTPKTFFLNELIEGCQYDNELLAMKFYLGLLSKVTKQRPKHTQKREIEISKLLELKNKDLAFLAIAQIDQNNVKLKPETLTRNIYKLRRKLGLENGRDFKHWCTIRKLDFKHIEATFLDYFILKRVIEKVV